MGTIHIRDIDDEVVKRLKHAAIDAGVTVKEYVVRAILASVGGEPLKADTTAESAPSGELGPSSAGMPTPPKTDPAKIPGVKRGLKKAGKCSHGNDPGSCPYSSCRGKTA